MKKKHMRWFLIVFMVGVIILPQYCPDHHKIDDCWKSASPYGIENGHK